MPQRTNTESIEEATSDGASDGASHYRIVEMAEGGAEYVARNSRKPIYKKLP